MSKEDIVNAVMVRLADEVDNAVYLLIALILVVLSGWGDLSQAGTKLADMLLGALLIKIKA